MILSITASADYNLNEETLFILMVEPRLHGPRHHVTEESLRTSHTLAASLEHDSMGNLLRRLLAPPGFFSYDFTALVEAESPEPLPDDALIYAARDLPTEVLHYTLPSRYCESDKLAPLAVSEFGSIRSGGARVKAVAEWVHSHLEYEYGTTDALTSACDTVLGCTGVCRDYAHLVVAFCRGLMIPARYVSGYCLGLEPPDFHAWAQVYLGGRWYDVDATYSGMRPALIPIATGRDATDVSMATLRGTGTLRAQYVSVRREDD